MSDETEMDEAALMEAADAKHAAQMADLDPEAADLQQPAPVLGDGPGAMGPWDYYREFETPNGTVRVEPGMLVCVAEDGGMTAAYPVEGE